MDLRPGVDVNCTDEFEGHTPLGTAIKEGDIKSVPLLLAEPRVRADIRDLYGCAPLSYAFESGNIDLVRFLLCRADVDVNATDDHGATLLARFVKDYGKR